jgi:predicted DNA-binding transcriptional regulator AlpA
MAVGSMTERKLHPSDLPGWPRLLSLNLAAAYVGISSSTFLLRVKNGQYPAPWRDGRRRLWDRVVIDNVIDALSKLDDPRNDLIGRARQFFAAKEATEEFDFSGRMKALIEARKLKQKS